MVAAEVRGLQRRRLAVLEDCLELELRLGRHHEVAGELGDLVREHPLRERLWVLLMLALHRDGQAAEALAAYRRARARLVAELGVEPGPELRGLARTILAADGVLEAPTPRQLPADTTDFTGRDEIVHQLEELLWGGHTGRAVVLSAITGNAGVGKTTLAVHVAHRLLDAFPDGQLYVDLRGGGPGQRAEPAEVLDRFLRALGLPGREIPDGLEERAEMYRSHLAARRILVVLDNAVDEAQLRPLVPGGAGCAVLITSRSRLAGLPGVRRVELDVLDPEHAVELLSRIVGTDRVERETVAARAIARLCGYLPLALRIAAARLVVRPDWTLGQLVDRLADDAARLTELRHGDLEVRASLSLSYQGLEPLPRRLFHLLGLLNAPDVAGWVCAALLDLDRAEATFQEMFGIAEKIGDPRCQASARYGLGLLRLETGALAAAKVLLDHALALNRRLGDSLTTGRIRLTLGELHRRRAEPEAAAVHITEAVRIFAASQTPLWQARALRALGDLHASGDDPGAARAAWTRARDLFAGVGSAEAAQVAAELARSEL